MRKIIVVISLAALLVWPGRSRAEIMAAPTVELLFCRADVVAVGRAVAVASVKGEGQIVYDHYRFTPVTMLKGEADESVCFTVRDWRIEGPSTREVPANEDVLVFLTRSDDEEDEVRGRLTPTWDVAPFSVVCLSRPGRYLFDRDQNILEDGSDVLRATYRAARDYAEYRRQHPDRIVGEKRIQVVEGAAHGELYAGSATYLILPDFLVDSSMRVSTPFE